MRATTTLFILVLLAGCGGGRGGDTGAASAMVEVAAAHASGLRSFDNGVNVIALTHLSINAGTEDRTVMHFAVTDLPASISTAILKIPVVNIDAGLPLGTLEVYPFAGDGNVSPDEWDAGTLLADLWNIPGGVYTISLDVTSVVKEVVAAAEPYVSFSLRGGPSGDRYNMGVGGGAGGDPSLLIIP